MRSMTRESISVALLVAAVPLLVGIDCEGRASLGTDDASMGSDGGALPPSDSGVVGVDAAVTRDSGAPMPDAGIAADFTAAARVCGMLGSCLHGQLWLDVCIVGAMNVLTAEEHRALTEGRAATFMTGDLLFSTTTDEPGFLPFREAPLSLPGLVTEPSFRTCVLSASSCEDVYTCLNEGILATACTPGPGTSRCDGDTLRACVYTDVYLDGFPADTLGRDARTLAVDCTAQGNSCVDSDAGGRNIHGCGPSACDAETFGPRCDGTTAVNCREGIVDRSPCAEGCRVVGTDARCVPGGASCDTTTTRPHCEGTTLVRCDDGLTYRSDCGGAPGFSCYTRSGYAYCGYGDECSIDESTSCVGSSIRRCVLGHYVDIDCTALGFTGCQTALGRDYFCD